MDKIFGILAFAYGIYLCFGSCKMKHTGLINTKILLYEDNDAYKCKDSRGYIDKMFPRIIIMGCAFLFYGTAEIYNSFTGKAGGIYWISFYVFFFIFLWFGKCISRYDKQFF